MDELLRQLIGYARGMWHHRWVGLGVAWVVGVIGAVVVFSMPDKYEASARVYVDTQSLLKPLMSGLAVQPNTEQQIGILSRTLISRPNVEKLIRMTDLDLKIKSKEDKERLIDEMIRILEIKGTGRDNLYTIAYKDSDREKARRVVQALVSIFVESGLGDKRKDADQAKHFIEEQIKNYEAKLLEAENKLKEFKVRNLALFGDGTRDYFGQIGAVSTQLNQARLELREAENSREALKRQIVGEEPVLLPDAPDAASQVSVPDIDGRIDTLKKGLDALLQRYTEEHPDVVGTKRVIEQLENQKREELKARKKTGVAPASVNSNPVYQQLKVSLAEAESNVASLKTRVAEYESRYAHLKSSANLVPQIEAEFAQLNRDYDVNKKNYESLVSRRESASLAGEMEGTSGMAEFRLIDPPRVSPKPVAPNRSLLLLAALAVTLGAGLAGAFMMSQIRPAIYDSRTLRELTGLPVLGNVSMVPNPERDRRKRRGVMAFFSASAALFASYGAILTFLLMSVRSA
jgi:polysaccharide chain length determinant protein (PEP-CTERM system associated)